MSSSENHSQDKTLRVLSERNVMSPVKGNPFLSHLKFKVSFRAGDGNAGWKIFRPEGSRITPGSAGRPDMFGRGSTRMSHSNSLPSSFIRASELGTTFYVRGKVDLVSVLLFSSVVQFFLRISFIELICKKLYLNLNILILVLFMIIICT